MSGPRTPLLLSQAYFQAHDGSPPLKHAALAVAIVAVVTAAGFGVFLAEFDAAVDSTIQVENPNHMPEMFCNSHGEGVATPSGCDPSVPETVERDVGTLVAEELSWLPWATLLVVPLFWLFQAVVLHAGSVLADGEGPFTDTLAVAGWGMTPGLARTLGVMALVVYHLRTTPIPGDPEGAITALQAALGGLGMVSLLAAVVVGVWAGAVRVYGLAAARNISVGQALVLVTATTFVGLLFEAL